MVKKGIPTETAGVYENIVIRASAGTGKTFQLSNRYLNLLASGVDCQEILATTFTKKGAGEILDRIIQRLSRAALSAKIASQLSGELGIPLDQQRAREVLQKLLRNLHRLEISTLDSFFNRVARVFSLELGLPPAWEIVDEQQVKALSRKTIHELLRKEDVATLIPLLEKGDATRKTASLIQSLVDRMYQDRRESKPAAWDRLEEVKTFLSASEIAEIQDRAAAMEFSRPSMTKAWGKILPMIANESWSELAEETWFLNVLQGTGKYGRMLLPEDNVALVQALIPHCRAWITHRLIKQNRATCELLGLYGERLDVTKSELGQLRFEDVTDKLVAFMSLVETDQFAFRLDHQIRHLLLDEFQDTSPTQWSIIKPFAVNVCHSNDPLRSFFCVGDMKQAIYGWRGGVAEIFDLVEETLEGLDIAQPLTTSYRSAQVVIDFVNDLFLNLKSFQSDDDVVNRAVHAWQDWFDLHSTARGQLGGHVTIEYAADCEKGSRNEAIISRKRNENLNDATVQRVQQLHETLPPEKTIGVLVPTNREVSRLIFLLQSQGIRASEEGGTALTDSASVELVLSALKLADHPGDSLARFHVSHSPLAREFDLEPETPENQPQNRIAAIEGAARLRDRLVQQGYGPTVESLARLLAPSCTKRELIRLQHLVRLAYASRSESQRWSMRPARFVEYIREEVKIADSSSARVRVMTIHKSKGLEFDAVVLPLTYQTNGWLGHTPNLIIGRPSPTEEIDTVCRYVNMKHRKLLPDSIQEIFEADQERTVRERMCRLYVALTRAAHALHIIFSYSHKPHGKSEAGVLLALLCPEIEVSGSGKNKIDTRSAGLIYERGDADWFAKQLPSQPQSDDEPQDGELDAASIRQYYLQNLTDNMYRPLSTAAKSMRGMARVRPSMLEGSNRVRLSETLRSPDRELAMEFGELMHCCFEQVHWLDEGQPLTDAELKDRLLRRWPVSRQIDKVLKRFRELLQNDNLGKLLSSSTVKEQHVIPDLDAAPASQSPNRIEVETEKRLAVLMDHVDHVASETGAMIEGIVDRLVLVYEAGKVVAAEIVDFKVDQIDGSNLTERIEFYRPQLAAYRDAIEKMLGLGADRIATRLVFVQTGQVVQVDSLDLTVDRHTDLKLPRKKKVGKKVAPPKKKPVKPPKATEKRPPRDTSRVQQTFWGDEDEPR